MISSPQDNLLTTLEEVIQEASTDRDRKGLADLQSAVIQALQAESPQEKYLGIVRHTSWASFVHSSKGHAKMQRAFSEMLSYLRGPSRPTDASIALVGSGEVHSEEVSTTTSGVLKVTP